MSTCAPLNVANNDYILVYGAEKHVPILVNTVERSSGADTGYIMPCGFPREHLTRGK